MCTLLERALAPVHRFRRVRDNRTNDERLAVGLHALNALDAARAVHTLSATDHAGTVALHVRTLFEVLVKIRWLRIDTARSRAFLESDPFERHYLATERIKKSARWAAIIEECDTVIAQNPDLLKLPKVFTGKNNPPNYDAVAKALWMPDIDVMVAEITAHAETKARKDVVMHEDDVLLDHDVTSLSPHTSIVHVKNFAKALNTDGTVTLSTRIDPLMLLNYVVKSATRTGQIMDEIFDLFPDGKISHDSEEAAARLRDVVNGITALVSRRQP